MKKAICPRLSMEGVLCLMLTLFASSCLDKKDYYDPNWERPHNSFNFETEAATTLNVSYENIGFPVSVYFEVYDEMPVEISGTVYVKKEGVMPIFTGYTDEDGTFTKELTLPSYLEKVYVYAPGFFAQTLIEATVSDGVITATDEAMSVSQDARSTRAGSTATIYKSLAYTDDGWKNWLGEWDESTGRIDGFIENTAGGTATVTLWDDDFSKYNNEDDEVTSLTGSKEGYTAAYTIAGDMEVDKGKLRIPQVDKGNANRITLPALTWEGEGTRDLTLTFKGKAASNTSPISLEATNGSLSKRQINLEKKSQNYTVVITGASSGVQITFAGAVGKKYKDAVIDDLKVTYTTTSTGESVAHKGYAFTDANSPLYITPNEAAALLTAHQSVINRKTTCPQIYRAYGDMLVNEDAEVVVSLLGGNTCWNSSLGYYYYKDGNPPTSLSEANVIMLYPNTQDGKYDVYPQQSINTQGVVRGTNVQLKYYGETPSKENETTVFPEGTRIGFVLACNTWTNRMQIWNCANDQKYRAATSAGLSIDSSGKKYTNTPRTAVYRYGDFVMISFEDFTDDENFSDVVITMKTDPVTAITDIVTVEDIVVEHEDVLKGIYAFEDIWPNEGDYDMNDLLVKCTNNYTTIQYKTTTVSTGSGNTSSTKVETTEPILYKESFSLKTFQNRADYTDGLACIMDLPAKDRITEINYYIKRPNATDFVAYTPAAELANEDIYNKAGGYTYNSNGTGQYNIIRLTGNVKEDLGAEYKIEIVYSTEAATAVDKDTRSEIHPFLYIEAGNGSLPEYYEVHIPYEAPTNKVSATYWSRLADASRPASETNGKGEFYLRANNITNNLYGPWYPFAIFLAGANEGDLSKLLDSSNETIAISELYPNYENWVNSNGTDYTDWYKE